MTVARCYNIGSELETLVSHYKNSLKSWKVAKNHWPRIFFTGPTNKLCFLAHGEVPRATNIIGTFVCHQGLCFTLNPPLRQKCRVSHSFLMRPPVALLQQVSRRSWRPKQTSPATGVENCSALLCQFCGSLPVAQSPTLLYFGVALNSV